MKKSFLEHFKDLTKFQPYRINDREIILYDNEEYCGHINCKLNYLELELTYITEETMINNKIKTITHSSKMIFYYGLDIPQFIQEIIDGN